MGMLNGVGERLAGRWKRYKPGFGTAYVTYFDVQRYLGREFHTSDRYEMRQVVDPDDPAVSDLPGWQQPLAREHLGDGSWIYVIATDRETGRKVGHVWMTLRTTVGFANGVMNVRLAPREVYVFDLYIDPEHRRASLGNGLAAWLVNNLGPTGIEWGYTHVLYDNAASIMWHHSFGLALLQMYNYVNIGDRIWFKVPLSDSPRYGPISRRGRHNDPKPPNPFGGALLPQDL